MAKTQRRVERRSPNRRPDPPCPMCGAPSDPKKVTIRAAFVFYKCSACRHIWEEEIPKDYRRRK